MPFMKSSSGSENEPACGGTRVCGHVCPWEQALGSEATWAGAGGSGKRLPHLLLHLLRGARASGAGRRAQPSCLLAPRSGVVLLPGSGPPASISVLETHVTAVLGRTCDYVPRFPPDIYNVLLIRYHDRLCMSFTDFLKLLELYVKIPMCFN